MSKGTCAESAARIASISVTSRGSASACCPRARIAFAASSISLRVRAASVTCAPTSASAAAAASPIPRPAPVRSARLPASRKEGVAGRVVVMEALTMPSSYLALCRAIQVLVPVQYQRRGWPAQARPLRMKRPCVSPSLRRSCIGDVAAAVAAQADIGLLGVTQKTFEYAKPRAIFPDQRRGLVGEHLLIGAGLEELADPKSAGIPRCLLGRQGMVGADHLVTIGDVSART